MYSVIIIQGSRQEIQILYFHLALSGHHYHLSRFIDHNHNHYLHNNVHLHHLKLRSKNANQDFRKQLSDHH